MSVLIMTFGVTWIIGVEVIAAAPEVVAAQRYTCCMPFTARAQSSGRVRSQRTYSMRWSTITGSLRCRVARTVAPSSRRRFNRLLPTRPLAPATNTLVPLSDKSGSHEEGMVPVDGDDFRAFLRGKRT